MLLVDDNPEVAAVSTTLLEQLGYTVRRVDNAEAALREIERDGIDLVFSDILMPGGMNGLELAHAISKRYASMPVLLTTGFPSSARDAAEQGFAVLQKPFDLAGLEQALLELSSLRQQQAQGAAG